MHLFGGLNFVYCLPVCECNQCVYSWTRNVFRSTVSYRNLCHCI